MRHKPSGTFNHDRDARAADALELARMMKPGPERNAALKEAGRLRAATSMGARTDSNCPKQPK